MGILFYSLLVYLLSLVNNLIFVSEKTQSERVNTSLSAFPKGLQSVQREFRLLEIELAIFLFNAISYTNTLTF